jgi:hypothetical protein
MNERVWSIGGMILAGETEVLGEKPDLVPLGWYRTRAFAVGGWQTLKTKINLNYT